MGIPIYISSKELWRNRGRFFLFSLVIALITVLVLFIAALVDGLGNGNKEYIEKLNGELIAFKSNVDLSFGASRVETFSNLIHEQKGAGIMVTHDLRMTEYADRIIRMMDGRVHRTLTHRHEISDLARAAGMPPQTRDEPSVRQVLGR